VIIQDVRFEVAGKINPASALEMLKRIRNCKSIFCKY
jgi:hypothetical protein